MSKTAVVTGGTKGIGRGIVEYLLATGHEVFTNYSSDYDSAEHMHSELGRYKDRLHIYKCNQGRREELKLFVDFIRSQAPKIDCIVANTGKTVRAHNFELTDDQWCDVMNVTVNSHFFLIRDLHDLISPNGRIIFIGSLMGITCHGTSLPYVVSKAAIHAMAKGLVKEFEGTGITVNSIAPGFIETAWHQNKPTQIRENIVNKTASHRFGEVSEVVSVVELILNNPYINGSTIEVSGGYDYK